MNYKIPEQNIEGLEKKLATIQKKCAKYGCEFHYERVGEHFENLGSEDEPCIVKFIDVEAEGKAVVNGWRYAAMLEYKSAGNIIHGVEGIEIPKRFYDCGPYCEHCKTNRERKNSYVVYNEESGEFKQVGSACLRDYTGGLSAEYVARFEQYFKTIEEASDWESSGCCWTIKYADIAVYMRYAAETIRCFGYSSRREGMGSADLAWIFMNYYEGWKSYSGKENQWIREYIAEAENKRFKADSEETVELAKKVTEWTVGNESDNNYFHNAKVIFAGSYCDQSNIGLMVSLFVAYDANLKREEEKAEREKADEEKKISEWVGNVGDRVSFAMKSWRVVTSWETDYGVTCIYEIIGEDGNVFTWKTGNCIDDDAKTIKGTVKSHNEFRGIRQTELTRCRIG